MVDRALGDGDRFDADGAASPRTSLGAGPVTLDIGGSAFRFDTLRAHDALLVAAQSTAATSNVQSTLLVAELVFGVILAVAVFAGATVVGLRASAPSELVRRRQAEFTADASHELRTPISVIEAEVGLALDRPRDPAAYREVLERVGRESTRLRRIVEDLLWLARADSEQARPGDADLADVAKWSRGVWSASGRWPRRTGSTSPCSGSAMARSPCRRSRTSSTAWRGSSSTTPANLRAKAVGSRSACADWGTRVDLRVDDSGPGIPEDQRDAVFDRFHRATD